jgi:hypothetical protein
MVYSLSHQSELLTRQRILTSGGMARDHMATPAVPPARITEGTDRGGAGALSPLGSVIGSPESFRLMSS